MNRKSRRGIRAAAILLSLSWLPYLIVQCPSCPEAVTTLVRCGLMASAAAAVEKPGQQRHQGNKPRCHQASDEGERSHDSDTGCCGLGENRSTTWKKPTEARAPTVAVLPWILQEPAQITHVRSAFLEPIEPHTHAPPLFLVLRSLLL